MIIFNKDKNNEVKMCKNKNKYLTQKDARRIGKVEIKLKRAKALYMYNCPFCNNYHLTHNSYISDIKKFKIK